MKGKAPPRRARKGKQHHPKRVGREGAVPQHLPKKEGEKQHPPREGGENSTTPKEEDGKAAPLQGERSGEKRQHPTRARAKEKKRPPKGTSRDGSKTCFFNKNSEIVQQLRPKMEKRGKTPKTLKVALRPSGVLLVFLCIWILALP